MNQEAGNTGLDERCRGLETGLRRAGGTIRVVSVPLQNPTLAQRRLSEAMTQRAGATASSRSARAPRARDPAVSAAGGRRGSRSRRSTSAPSVLAAVRDGKILFAVDQQPYLQGFLPVMLLSELALHKVFPGKGELIPTGPQFVTKANAAEVIQLSEEGIR